MTGASNDQWLIEQADLVETVDSYLGQQLRNVTVAPMN